MASTKSPLVIDLDATLITAHSEKEQAAPTFNRGFVTGTWTVPFLVLGILLIAQLAAGIIASRPVHIRARVRSSQRSLEGVEG